MARIVQKFGGSSLKNPKFIENAASIIINEASQGNEVVAVVSAMGKTTDELIGLANQINSNPSLRELDLLLSSGEQISSSLMSIALQKRGAQARAFTGLQAKIITDSNFGEATIKEIDTQVIEASLSRGEIPVVAGFQGSCNENDITTLGRGGSDTTAVALAYAIDAERCDIYTDVAGVYTADPNLIPNSKQLETVDYDTMYQMAISGAKVLNSDSVELAKRYDVAVNVKSTFEPERQGTLVTNKLFCKPQHLTSLSLDLNQTMVNVKLQKSAEALELVSSLFIRLAELKTNIDMFMMLEPNDIDCYELNFAINKNDEGKISKILADNDKQIIKSFKLSQNLAKISLIGNNLNSKPQIIGQLFELVKSEDVKLELVSTSDLRFSFLVNKSCAQPVVVKIHNNFFER